MTKTINFKYIFIALLSVVLLGCAGGSEDGNTNADDSDASSRLFPSDRVVKVTFNISDEDWASMLANPIAEEYKTASIVYDGIEVTNVAIRTKGNSSLMSVAGDSESIRYSFKIDINYYEDNKRLLGLKKLNFNNIFSDPSMMRETLSYELMADMGLPASRIAYVDLYVGEQHIGLYNVVEHVDSDYLNRNFGENDGDLYKAETNATLLYTSNLSSDYSAYELQTNEETSDKSKLIQAIDTLSNGAEPLQYFNVDAFLRYLATSTVLTNLDSYQGSLAHNYYLYEENGVFTMLPWDFNMSFAGFSMGCDESTLINFMIDEPTSGAMKDRPLIQKVLENPAWKAQYHQYVEELINNHFSEARLFARIEEIATLIDPYVQADPTKFYSYEEWQTALTESITADTGDASSDNIALDPQGLTASVGLREFISARIESVRKQLNGELPSAGDGSGNCVGGFGPGGNFAPPTFVPPTE